MAQHVSTSERIDLADVDGGPMVCRVHVFVSVGACILHTVGLNFLESDLSLSNTDAAFMQKITSAPFITTWQISQKKTGIKNQSLNFLVTLVCVLATWS